MRRAKARSPAPVRLTFLSGIRPESWTQAAKLTADDAAEDDQFAYSVAVYDDTVVIGAHQDDDDGAESGSAYVFTKPANGGWTSTNTAVKLTAPDAAAGG